MEKAVEYYVCIVKRNKVGIDKYYRKEERDAIALKKMNSDLYPKATVTVVREIIVEK